MKNVIKIFFTILFFFISTSIVFSFVQNSPDWLPFHNNLFMIIFCYGILVLNAVIVLKLTTWIINEIYKKNWKNATRVFFIYFIYISTIIFLDIITFPIM